MPRTAVLPIEKTMFVRSAFTSILFVGLTMSVMAQAPMLGKLELLGQFVLRPVCRLPAFSLAAFPVSTTPPIPMYSTLFQMTAPSTGGALLCPQAQGRRRGRN